MIHVIFLIYSDVDMPMVILHVSGKWPKYNPRALFAVVGEPPGNK